MTNVTEQNWNRDTFYVLNHGYVRVIEHMGTDAGIESDARLSYQQGTRPVSDTRTLLRYMMRHKHTSPFEGAIIKFEIKAPIFVARQWFRHRSSSYNEVSGRYSVLPNEFYIPDPDQLGTQSKSNKQGRTDNQVEDTDKILNRWMKSSDQAFDTYEYFLEEDLTRELARSVLPVSTYTTFRWTINARNLMHFLSLRDDPHAQWEIQQYAKIISDMLSYWLPLTHEAYIDYVKDAVNLSRMEAEIIRIMVSALDPMVRDNFFLSENTLTEKGLSKREVEEFIKKIRT